VATRATSGVTGATWAGIFAIVGLMFATIAKTNANRRGNRQKTALSEGHGSA